MLVKVLAVADAEKPGNEWRNGERKEPETGKKPNEPNDIESTDGRARENILF